MSTIHENIPEDLKKNGLFCVWRYIIIDGVKKKVPYNPISGKPACTNDVDTFGTFEDAVMAMSRGKYDGIGVLISGNLAAIDLDHCLTDNDIEPWAQDIVNTMHAYTEISPSGRGLRLLFPVTHCVQDKQRYYINRRLDETAGTGIEIYVAGATNKYVTITGDVLPIPHDVTWESRDEELRVVLERYMVRPAPQRVPTALPSGGSSILSDAEVLDKAQNARNGAQFQRLWAGDHSGYNSPSEADLALCNILAFWTGCDAAQMDRLYRQSGLMRDKWDRRQSGSSYGAITIQRAIEGCRNVYEAPSNRPAGAAGTAPMPRGLVFPPEPTKPLPPPPDEWVDELPPPPPLDEPIEDERAQNPSSSEGQQEKLPKMEEDALETVVPPDNVCPDAPAADAVPSMEQVQDYRQFTYDDYMDTDRAIKLLYAEKNAYRREKLLNKLDEHAKSVGYKHLRKDWKAFCQALEEKRRAEEHSDGNVVRGLPADIWPQDKVMYCGQWISTEKGVCYIGGKNLVVVCPHPIIPVARYVDIDTQEEKLQVAFCNGECWKKVVIAKNVLFSSDIVDALSSIGAAVTSQTSRLLSQYLAETECYNHDQITEYYTTHHLGYYEGYGFVPYIDNLVYDGDSAYADAYKAITQKGSAGAWLDHVAGIWNHSVEARIAIVASFASVVLHRVGVQPFFVHLWSSQGGTGKTVTLHVAASVWGNPDCYVKSLNNTRTSMEYMAGFYRHLPLMLDELQVTKDENGKSRFSVYDLAEGIGRGRACKTGGLCQTERWHNLILTNGESALVSSSQGSGAFLRAMQISFLQPIIEDGPRTSALVREHYGWAGKLFVERVLDNPEVMSRLKEEYQCLVQCLSAPDAGKKINGKHANAVAILLATAAAVRQYVYEGYEVKELEMEDILPYVPDEQDISLGKRGYDYILDWIATNQNSFVDERPARPDSYSTMRDMDEVHGKLYGKIRADGVTLVIRSVLEEALEEKKFAPEAVFQWMRKKDKLKVRDGVSAVYSINGNRVRCVAILTGSQASQGE